MNSRILILGYLIVMVISCSPEKGKPGYSPEEKLLRQSHAGSLADFIVKKTGLKQGICVEIDATDGDIAYAMTRITSMEIYPQVADESTLRTVRNTIKMLGEC